MQHFTSFFLKFKFILLVESVFFLLNAAFDVAFLDLISRVKSCIVHHATHPAEIFHIPQFYLSIIICIWDDSFEMFITLDFSIFISISQHPPIFN